MYASSIVSVWFTLHLSVAVRLAHGAQYPSVLALLPTVWSPTISPPSLPGCSVSRSWPALPSALYYLYLLPLVFSTLLTLWSVPVPPHGKSYSFLRYVRRLLALAPCSKSFLSALEGLCIIAQRHPLSVPMFYLCVCLTHWNVSFLRRKIPSCSFLFL